MRRQLRAQSNHGMADLALYMRQMSTWRVVESNPVRHRHVVRPSPKLRAHAVQAPPRCERFGPSPDLSEVVEAVAHLASTLIILAGQGIAHRDLKPPNLFWLDGEAVLGDLGIATWPQRRDQGRGESRSGLLPSSGGAPP